VAALLGLKKPWAAAWPCPKGKEKPMAQRVFQLSFHVPGSLAADLDIKWTAPFDCTLLHVSAVSSDADAAGLEIGDSADADEYLTKASCGVSGTPVEFDGDDFVDTSGNTHNRYYPRIVKGTIIAIAVDYNYNGGGGASASADLTIVLTFAEG
jgi:hypothetical protein